MHRNINWLPLLTTIDGNGIGNWVRDWWRCTNSNF
jgi:hypothetical protein